MDWIVALKALLQPTAIYSAGFEFSKYVAPVSGVLLLFTAHLRVVETQLAGHGMAGGWAGTLKAIALWSAVLGLYYAFVAFLISVANEFYAALNQIGGISEIVDGVTAMQKTIEEKAKAEQQASSSVLSAEFWERFAAGVAAVPGVLASALIFKLATFLLFTLTAFLRMVHAMLFSLAFILGLLVIPLAVSERLSLLTGWKALCYFVFVWPLVEALMLGMAALPFKNAAAQMLAQSSHYASWDSVNFLTVVSVMCVVLILLQVAAAVIAFYLVANSGNVSGYMQPFLNIIHKVARRGR